MTENDSKIAGAMLLAAKTLREETESLALQRDITCVYNPLRYAWEPYSQYVNKWAGDRKKVLFLGMNPGPWGMAQVGVPFGEITLVREWIGVSGRISQPSILHPKKPIMGFSCKRSEVSGRRLWSFFAEKFNSPDNFFKCHFVENYCPLLFMEENGKNRTPDKLPSEERERLYLTCDKHLRKIVNLLQPSWVVGIGAFAEKRATVALREFDSVNIARILHPSPASPAANRGWSSQAEQQLIQQGVWPLQDKVTYNV
ncbi:MAG: uracil-DNA glycosylase family protein [Verrucomicrobiota bacterium]